MLAQPVLVPVQVLEQPVPVQVLEQPVQVLEQPVPVRPVLGAGLAETDLCRRPWHEPAALRSTAGRRPDPGPGPS